MRKFSLLLLVAAMTLPAFAQTEKAKLPYTVEFDKDKDVDSTFRPADGAQGIFVKVRFAIKLEGSEVDKIEGDYKLLIEENGQVVKVVDVPRPIVSDALSVVLAMDTSGSMKQFRRMEQARAAADVFLNKLPSATDCGLVLFDHEVRARLDTTLERKPLLELIHKTDPRGGTAYLDAAAESVKVLRNIRGRDRAVVLMTDGVDLNSKKTVEQVIQEAQTRTGKVDVRIFTIGIGEKGQKITVNTVLVLDHSGSMTPPADDNDKTPKIEALHLAAERFVESMSPDGRVSIVPFSTLVTAPRPFRSKKEIDALRGTIKALKPSGETALFDACHEAISVLEADNQPGKRAIVAMTDGFDNSSRRRVEEVKERAIEAKIPVYLIGFGRANEIDAVTMRDMAEATGGKYHHAINKDKLIEIFEGISSDLHDDGIDEATLKRIAKETGGKYYLAKDVDKLKEILEKVGKSIQRESHEIIFKSLNQRADGMQRNVALKLVQGGEVIRDEQTGTYHLKGGRVLDERTSTFFQRGLVVAEMNHLVYLLFLVIIGGLIALPGLLRRGAA